MFCAEAFDMYYDKLVDSLPMKSDEFLADFNEILPGDLKANILAQLTPAAGAICFLDNVVKEDLDDHKSDHFELLLSMMKKFSDNNLKMLAKEIQHSIEHKIEELECLMVCTNRVISLNMTVLNSRDLPKNGIQN